MHDKGSANHMDYRGRLLHVFQQSKFLGILVVKIFNKHCRLGDQQRCDIMHCHALQPKNVIYWLLYYRMMSLETIPVSSVMTKNVITQTEDQTIQAISRTMFENNIGNVTNNKEQYMEK